MVLFESIFIELQSKSTKNTDNGFGEVTWIPRNVYIWFPVLFTIFQTIKYNIGIDLFNKTSKLSFYVNTNYLINKKKSYLTTWKQNSIYNTKFEFLTKRFIMRLSPVNIHHVTSTEIEQIKKALKWDWNVRGASEAAFVHWYHAWPCL